MSHGGPQATAHNSCITAHTFHWGVRRHQAECPRHSTLASEQLPAPLRVCTCLVAGYGDDYHHHKYSNYGGQQYSRGDSYYPYGPEGESYSPYKPSYGPQAKQEDVCVQEVAQSNCEVSGNDRSYT